MKQPITAREMLDTIDRFLANGDHEEGVTLWHVLTALRGPDSDNSDVKDNMTCPIRRAALPECAARYDSGRQLPGGPLFTDTEYNDVTQLGALGAGSGTYYGHFYSHASGAARDLHLGIYAG